MSGVIFEPGLPAIPLALLRARDAGRLLFIAGAGVSQPSGLPDFERLVVRTYGLLDRSMMSALQKVVRRKSRKWRDLVRGFTADQRAELARFAASEFDVVLGMLERRIDEPDRGGSHAHRHFSRYKDFRMTTNPKP